MSTILTLPSLSAGSGEAANPGEKTLPLESRLRYTTGKEKQKQKDSILMNPIVQDILHIIQPRLELEPTVPSTAAARGAAHVTLNTCTTWEHWAQD